MMPREITHEVMNILELPLKKREFDIFTKCFCTEDEFGNPQLDFEKIMPVPDHIFLPTKWKYENWGTRYNAFETVIDRTNRTIYFKTLWCAPHKVLRCLSLFTHTSLLHKWCGETDGFNVGTVMYHETGRVIYNIPTWNSDPAYALSRTIRKEYAA